MGPPTEHERRFAAFLGRLVEDEDRAALAALRRGMGKRLGEVADPFPYVVPWVPAQATAWQEEAYYLVAGLFAWHQKSWSAGDSTRGLRTLGASFALLAGAVESDSIEHRFVALLNAHPEDLAEHLRRVVGLLKAHEIPVDWAQLLHDLQQWRRDDRDVQREWARAYWGRRQTDAGGPGTTADSTPAAADGSSVAA